MKGKKRKKEKVDLREILSIYWRIVGKYKHLAAISIFVIILINLSKIGQKFLFKWLVDWGGDFASHSITLARFVYLLWILLFAYLVILLVESLGGWVKMSLINRIDINCIYDLKKKFFDHIVDLDYSFHTKHKTGSLIARIGRGSRAIEGMNDFLVFQAIPVFVQLLISGAAIFYFDKLSSVVLLAVTFAFLTFNFIFSKMLKENESIANNAEDREKAFVSDVLTNIAPVKFFGKDNLIKRKFQKKAKETADKSLRAWNFYRWMDAGNTIIVGFGLIALMYLSLRKLLLGQTTVGTVVFIYAVYFGFLMPLYSFVWGVRHVMKSTADIKSLFEYDKVKKKIIDKPGAKKMKIERGEIVFDNVSFGYNKKKVIKNFNLRIKPNEKIALVGHSGSGKSTLVKLLYRFYDVSDGRILIDGVDIRDVQQESLRAEMSIVPQDCVLFDDTIYNNVAFSNPKADRKEVIEAMKLARLWDFVKNLPKKEKTIVGERGIKLSGGEKQRVSIARAILANKKVLVLDEATSSLDSKTEFEIQQALENLLKGRTSIIIAHRLSTIMRADRIIVLNKGRISQIGTHKDLLKKTGIYKDLWNLQKGGYLDK